MFWSRFPQYNYNIKAHISIIVSETCPVEGHALFIKVLLNVTTYSSDLWKWKKSIHKDIQFFFEKLVWKATDQNSVSPTDTQNASTLKHEAAGVVTFHSRRAAISN